MKINNLKYFSILLFLVIGLSSAVKANNIKLEELSTREGLSNGNINWITQDRQGYLWISTVDGLNKYDGYSFTNYRFDPDDPYSISANWNSSVFADSSDNLWLILSTGGITRYNKSTNRFYRYALENKKNGKDPSYVSTFFCDSRGDIWLGTFKDGLYRIKKTDDTSGIGKEDVINYYPTEGDEKSLSGKRVFSISEDAENNIWVCTNNGLTKITTGSPPAETNLTNYRLPEGNIFVNCQSGNNNKIYIASYGSGLIEFDSKSEKFKPNKHTDNDEKSISSDTVRYISEEIDGKYRWVFTSNGVNKFYNESSSFKHYKHNPSDSSSIINGGYIFYRSVGGSEYFGTRNGISKYNNSADNFSNYYFRDGHENVFSRYYVKFIDVDNSGIFWIGTSGGGIVKYNIMQNNFDELNFESIFEDKIHSDNSSISTMYKDNDGVLWLGTEGSGLLSFEPEQKDIISRNIKNSGIKSNWISSIIESDGKLWIGTRGRGISIYDKVSDKFSDFPLAEKGPEIDKLNLINAIIKDRKGNMYFGTNGGLIVYDPVTKTRKLFKPDQNNSNAIGSGNVWVIYEDSDGDIWLGTAVEGNNGGLSKFNKNDGTFKNYVRNPNDTTSINNQTVNCIYEDSKGTLWIGTYSGGLNAFDKRSEVFTHYTVKQGLPSNTINGILEDSKGNLWLSTNKGISKFNPSEKTFINYDNDDGISGYEYNRGAFLKTSINEGKEMFLYGSKEGMDSFYPEEIKRDRFIPPIVITSFKVLDNSRVPPNSVNSADTVYLSYDENFFSFEFSSLDFDNPRKNIYKYMLEGFDKEWVNANDRRYAGYTNIEPGTYKFTVAGTNSDGIWNDKGTSVVLIISPPFWNTWWFYILVAVAIVSVTLFLINLRVKRKVKYLLEIEKVKASERELVREEASRDYHDELGHKLTRISLFSRRILKRVNGNTGLRDDLNSIVETSNSLQSGAKDLIWALNPEEDSMYDVCVRLRDFGNDLFEDSGINFTSDNVPDQFRSIKLSMTKKRHIIYIFKEGMTNILKHSGCNEVRLNFKTIDERTVISLSDNGIGFNPNNGQKGYGIKNIINRSKHIECKVEITSEESNGTLLSLDIIP